MESAWGNQSAPLPAEVRVVMTQKVLEQRGFVRVRDLAARFGVSAVTVRNDLQVLEERQLAHRVHGGAIAANAARGERSFEEVAARRPEEKAAIGITAAGLVADGETVIVDVGTTAAAFARALVDRVDLTDVTIITNGIAIALVLEAAHPRFTVVVTGGTLRPKQHSLVEPLATGIFDSLRVDTVFLGCNGVSAADGVTNVNLPEAVVKRAMIAAADRCVVLADSTKLGVRALAPVCTIGEVDVLVTDGDAATSELDPIRVHGVDLVVATTDSTTRHRQTDKETRSTS